MSQLQISELHDEVSPVLLLSTAKRQKQNKIFFLAVKNKIPHITLTFLLFYGNTDDTVYLKMWWESTVAPNLTIKNQLHPSLQLSPVKCFALRIKDLSAYYCLIHSAHLFFAFILCSCVTAVLITLVIDHSSGHAPASTLYWKLDWNDSISFHLGG